MNLEFFLNQNKPHTLNIVTFPTHERYFSSLAKTGHNFFLWRGPGIKDWEFNYADLPKNSILLPNPTQKLPNIQPDIILSQNKAGQFNVAAGLAQKYMCPLISLEHCLPVGHSPEQIKQSTQVKGDINVYISEFSMKAWGATGKVIHHGVDSDLFRDEGVEREDRILSVVNDWINRGQILGFDIFQAATKGLPTTVKGATPGLSTPAGPEELAQIYNKHSIFLSTHRESPIPSVILEAALCGCCIVSTPHCMVSEIFTHTKDAFLGKTPTELRYYLEYLLKNPQVARQVGEQGRQTILEKFSMDKFVKNWNETFTEAIKNYR